MSEILEELRARGVRYEAARADARPAARARDPRCRWRRPATPPTTGCRTRSPAAATVRALRRRRCGRRSTPRQVLFDLLSGRDVLAARADGRARRRRAGSCCSGPTPPRSQGRRPLVGRRRRAARRARRPPRAHAEPRATSCSTRRRTCRRCSCARSAGAARPARRPCSATSRRGRRRGRPTRGRRRWRTSGKPDGHVEVLDRGFRVPASVIDFAARLLPSIAPGLGAPVSVRDEPGPAGPRPACRPAAVARRGGGRRGGSSPRSRARSA